MFIKRIGVPFMALTMLGLFALTASAAGPTNGDFETGDLTGWEVFTTSNGTGSSPFVEQIDIANVGVMTNAVKLSVGQVTPNDGGCGDDAACRNSDFSIFEGAGVRQSFDVDTDGIPVAVTANVATTAPDSSDVQTGGLFELLVDDVVVDWVLFTSIAAGSTLGDSLAANVPLSIGSHTVAVRVSRPWGTFGMDTSSPIQYIDEVFVGGRPVPTPTPEPPEPEVTPEPTPVVTPEPTPVVTPEPTPEVTPEPAPEVTPEPTATPEPEVTPEPTPETSPEPEATHEPPEPKFEAPTEPEVDTDKDEKPVLDKVRIVRSGFQAKLIILLEKLLLWLQQLFGG